MNPLVIPWPMTLIMSSHWNPSIERIQIYPGIMILSFLSNLIADERRDGRGKIHHLVWCLMIFQQFSGISWISHIPGPWRARSAAVLRSAKAKTCRSIATCCDPRAAGRSNPWYLVLFSPQYQWIGFVGENLNRKPWLKYHQIFRGFRLKFSHHPILWPIAETWV